MDSDKLFLSDRNMLDSSVPLTQGGKTNSPSVFTIDWSNDKRYNF